MSTCFTCVQGNKENTRGIKISVATMLTFDMFFAEIKVQIFPPLPLFLFFFSEKRASRWTSSHRSAILLNRQKRSRGGKERSGAREGVKRGGREGIRGKVDETSEKRR